MRSKKFFFVIFIYFFNLYADTSHPTDPTAQNTVAEDIVAQDTDSTNPSTPEEWCIKRCSVYSNFDVCKQHASWCQPGYPQDRHAEFVRYEAERARHGYHSATEPKTRIFIIPPEPDGLTYYVIPQTHDYDDGRCPACRRFYRGYGLAACLKARNCQ